MNSLPRRVAAALLGTLAIVAGLSAFTGTAQARDTVTITGNAYAFIFAGNMDRLEGAVIRVVEYPELQAVAGPNGAYSLEVPNNASITPYATHPGYYTVHDQTFYTRGRDLNQVNFQMPIQPVAEALAAVVGASMEGEEGSKVLTECAVVSTFFQKEGRSFFDFDDFHDFRPHGVVGATADLRSADGKSPTEPVYFNNQVIPDPAWESSSRDGGVLWKDVPTGVYTVTGSHPEARFSQFQASCAPGRLVNANPPWGLYELARTEEPNPAVFPAPEPDPEPEPEVDETLRAWVKQARVVRQGPRRRTLAVRIDAREDVRVNIVGGQGKRLRVKRLIRRTTPGERVITVPVRAAFRRGVLNLNVALADQAGNRTVTNARLFMPGLRAAPRARGR